MKMFNILEKLHVLSFIFIPFFRRCPFQRILTGFVLYKEFSYMFCPLTLTKLIFFVKTGYSRVF
ncbi:hypothetical protein Hanom_Chr08g00735101 [Helianthus anomalus]